MIMCGFKFENDTPTEPLIFYNCIVFDSCIFKEKVDFMGSIFLKTIDFMTTIFEKEVKFSQANFTGMIINFSAASFKNKVNFSFAKFEDKVDFREEKLNVEKVIFQKEINFKGTTFQKEINFSAYTFKENVYFNNSHFCEYADFHECEFEKIACFYGVSFDNPPNFSQAIFKGNLNLVNAKLNFSFRKLQKKIKQVYKGFNKDKEEQDKKPLENFANNFRDSFRIFKSALIKDNNLLDASNFHRVELYCKEIELENKQEKSLKDKVDKYMLKLYRLISDHHTDLLQAWHTLLCLIGIFGLLSYTSIIVFNFCFLGFWDYNPYNSIEIYNIHTKHSLLDNYKLLGINFFILVAFMILFFAVC